MFNIPKFPTPDSIQAHLDGALAKAPKAVRDRIEWVRYVTPDVAQPKDATQTLVFTDVSSGEAIAFALKSKGFGTEMLIEFAMRSL